MLKERLDISVYFEGVSSQGVLDSVFNRKKTEQE